MMSFTEDFSDDDEVRKKIDNYKLNENLRKFKNNHLINADEILSFIVHAAGIRVLYSPDVQKRYNELKEELKTQIPEKFPQQIQKKSKPIVKEKLKCVEFDLSKIPSENFVVEFLSYLRLHNRIEKRQVKIGKECEDTLWHIFPTSEGKVKTKNTKSFNARNEQVYLKGKSNITYVSNRNYVKFFEGQTENNFRIFLNNRLNIKKTVFEDNSALKDILSLWYLVFGCEVIRNPAAIITNNFSLDIWKDKLNKDEDYQNAIVKVIEDMPMTESGIVQVAMSLNAFLGDFMPINYQYKKHSENKDMNKLIKRESTVTRKWLALIVGDNQKAEALISGCVTDDKAVNEIYGLIIKSYEKWGVPNENEDILDSLKNLSLTGTK